MQQSSESPLIFNSPLFLIFTLNTHSRITPLPDSLRLPGEDRMHEGRLAPGSHLIDVRSRVNGLLQVLGGIVIDCIMDPGCLCMLKGAAEQKETDRNRDEFIVRHFDGNAI